MHTVREPSPWLQVVTFFGGLLVGPYSALRVVWLLEPDSGFMVPSPTWSSSEPDPPAWPSRLA